jgi:hypothetical protein
LRAPTAAVGCCCRCHVADDDSGLTCWCAVKVTGVAERSRIKLSASQVQMAVQPKLKLGKLAGASKLSLLRLLTPSPWRRVWGCCRRRRVTTAAAAAVAEDQSGSCE